MNTLLLLLLKVRMVYVSTLFDNYKKKQKLLKTTIPHDYKYSIIFIQTFYGLKGTTWLTIRQRGHTRYKLFVNQGCFSLDLLSMTEIKFSVF